MRLCAKPGCDQPPVRRYCSDRHRKAMEKYRCRKRLETLRISDPEAYSARMAKRTAWISAKRKSNKEKMRQRIVYCVVCKSALPQGTSANARYCGIHNPNHSRRSVSFWLPPHGIGTCSWCGDWYGRSFPRQSTCSPKCSSRLRAPGPVPAAKYRAEYRKCTVCNEEFQTTMKRRKYCGKALCKARGRPWSPEGLKQPYAARSRYVQLRRAAEAVGDKTLTTLTMWQKAGGTCAYCRIETLDPQTPRAQRSSRRFNWATLDHIVPLSQGGGHEWSNAQLLCLSCNSRKSHTDRQRGAVVILNPRGGTVPSAECGNLL